MSMARTRSCGRNHGCSYWSVLVGGMWSASTASVTADANFSPRVNGSYQGAGHDQDHSADAGDRAHRPHSFFNRSLASDGLTVIQWNPHWQCFQKCASCKVHAEHALNEELMRSHVDFANVIELMDDTYVPPRGFLAISHTCNQWERATIIFDSSSWIADGNDSASVLGCMRPHDRAFVVQRFFRAEPNYSLRSVVVVGAHYPHASNVPILRDAIAQVRRATGEDRVMFLADTNQVVPSRIIAEVVGIPEARSVLSSRLFKSCCLIHQGFVWKFDRVIANFGREMRSTMLHHPTPFWAGESFHKAVLAVVEFPTGVEVAVNRQRSHELQMYRWANFEDGRPAIGQTGQSMQSWMRRAGTGTALFFGSLCLLAGGALVYIPQSRKRRWAHK